MDNINPIWIAVGAAVLLVILYITIYNGLVRLKNNREDAFADIDVQLKQRHDLISQLIGTVKGAAAHEKEILIQVTEARQKAVMASGVNDKIAAEVALSQAMSGFNLQMEAYPDLKANQNFLQLQQEIADIENKLAAVRRYFNSATKELNTGVEKFPHNIIAGIHGYKQEPYFDLGEQQRQQLDQPPEIKF